jgi:predicted PurR-regulated permease PerM
MNADQLVKILVAVIGLMVALLGPIGWVVKSLINYQTTLFNAQAARISVLEAREQTALTGLVGTIENMADSVKITSDFTVKLMDDLRYRERRNAEDRGGTQ